MSVFLKYEVTDVWTANGINLSSLHICFFKNDLVTKYKDIPRLVFMYLYHNTSKMRKKTLKIHN